MNTLSKGELMKHKSSEVSIVWFRRDLRLRDNPAYYHGVKKGAVIAVYTLCQKQWDYHNLSLRQRTLIAIHLKSLEKSLAKEGVPLLVINCGDFSSVTESLIKLAKKNQCSNILFNQEYEINERKLTSQIIKESKRHGINTQAYHDQCLIEPGKIFNKQGQPYKVFTAFKKSYLKALNGLIRPLYGKPNVHTAQSSITVPANIKALNTIVETPLYQPLLITNENQAHQLLNAFCAHRISEYKLDRDLPAVQGTSGVSACLATGLLTVRQCYQAAYQQAQEAGISTNKEGITTWINELVWRDFYRHLIFLFPHLCMHKPFQETTDRLSWKHDQQLFDAWKQGNTGYPIVDAAMRQLNETGWMHNRLRMITAMFLTKHLFIDWRWGEEYFMKNLIDADFASNNGGWQWSASTGVDAAPYFRIFNPTRQSERFDSSGLFIRQYLPELASLDNKSIHSPSPEQVDQLGYLHPIVDHAGAVAQTKLCFKRLDTGIKV